MISYCWGNVLGEEAGEGIHVVWATVQASGKMAIGAASLFGLPPLDPPALVSLPPHGSG